MTSEPLVTIGIICFNQGRFADAALASVAHQSYRNLEIIIVDDGSSDDSVSVIYETIAKYPRLAGAQFIHDGENRGLQNRQNQVLEHASGQWISWLAIDDVLEEDAIRIMLDAARSFNDVDVIFGNLDVVDVDLQPKGYVRPRDTWQGHQARTFTTPGPVCWSIFKVNNFVSGGMSLISVETLRSVGGYDPSIRTEDLNLWLTLGPTGRFLYVDTIMGKYRVVPGSKSRVERRHVLDTATLCGKLRSADPRWNRGLTRLVAMRWALSVARERGRPSVSLKEVADVSGFGKAAIVRELPRAGTDPILGNLTTMVRLMRSRM